MVRGKITDVSSSRQKYREFRKGASGVTPAADAAAHPSAAGAPHDAATRQDRPTRRSLFREYLAWLRPFRAALLLVVGVALLTALLGLVLPRATMYIIDVALPQRDTRTLHGLGMLLLVLILVQQLVELYRNWQLGRRRQQSPGPVPWHMNAIAKHLEHRRGPNAFA